MSQPQDRKEQKSSALIIFVLCLAMGAYTYFVSSSMIHRHHMFYTFFDLALFDQIFWNFAHGNWFVSSLESCESYLGIHFSPILLLLVPVYMIRESPITLIVVRTFLISLGAIPAFFIAKRFFQSNRISLALAVLFLANPIVVKVNLENHFNPEGLLIPILLFAVMFLFAKRIFLFLLFCVLACLVKEDAPLTVSFLGLFAAIIQKERRVGIAVFAFSLIYFAIVVGAVLPHFACEHQYYVRAGGGFQYLGDDVGSILIGLIQNPLSVLGEMVRSAKLLYLFMLIFSVGLLPLLGLPFLLPAIPALFINLVSGSDSLTEIFTRYSAPIAPFVFVAAIAGLKHLRNYLESKNNLSKTMMPFLVVLMFSCSVLVHVIYFEPKPRIYRHAEVSKKIISLIPGDRSVMATPNFLPHLSKRKHINEIIHPAISEYVLLETNPAHWITHWMAQRKLYTQKINDFLNDPSYQRIAEQDGIVLLKRK